MKYIASLSICFFLSLFCFSEDISLRYERMNEDTFQKVIVGNTLVGRTSQSHSLYMLYFTVEGECELWKKSQIYLGHWWIEKDKLGQDIVRAFWPSYHSSEADSLFSPMNPRYGTATSVRYYFDPHSRSVFLANSRMYTSAVLIPGRAFP